MDFNYKNLIIKWSSNLNKPNNIKVIYKWFHVFLEQSVSPWKGIDRYSIGSLLNWFLGTYILPINFKTIILYNILPLNKLKIARTIENICMLPIEYRYLLTYVLVTFKS